MLPSTSAYTMFCAGTSKSAAAARNEVQSVALFSLNSASAVGPGSSAVQRSATACPSCAAAAGTPADVGSSDGVGAGSTVGSGEPDGLTAGRAAMVSMSPDRSDSSGPCLDERTVTVTGSPPATVMV